jgi:hypothetical protein
MYLQVLSSRSQGLLMAYDHPLSFHQQNAHHITITNTQVSYQLQPNSRWPRSFHPFILLLCSSRYQCLPNINQACTNLSLSRKYHSLPLLLWSLRFFNSLAFRKPNVSRTLPIFSPTHQTSLPLTSFEHNIRRNKRQRRHHPSRCSSRHLSGSTCLNLM